MMLQTIPEILVSGLMLLGVIVALYWIGTRAKSVSIGLEQDILKLPLTNPEGIEDSHKSRVLQMKHKWQRITLFRGFSTISENLLFWMILFNSIFIYDNFVDSIFLGMYIFLLLFSGCGLGTGIFHIIQKNSFWDGQINQVKWIESNLERYIQSALKERPKERTTREFYPEVELNIRLSWERNLQSALKHEITHEIYSRELSYEDQKLLLEHLARREDIIGQIATEIHLSIQETHN